MPLKSLRKKHERGEGTFGKNILLNFFLSKTIFGSIYIFKIYFLKLQVEHFLMWSHKLMNRLLSHTVLTKNEICSCCMASLYTIFTAFFLSFFLPHTNLLPSFISFPPFFHHPFLSFILSYYVPFSLLLEIRPLHNTLYVRP